MITIWTWPLHKKVRKLAEKRWNLRHEISIDKIKFYWECFSFRTCEYPEAQIKKMGELGLMARVELMEF